MSNIYLSENNVKKYQPIADKRKMELGTLINDILDSIDPKKVKWSSLSYQNLFPELLRNVKNYVHTIDLGEEFVIRNIPGWKKVNQLSISETGEIVPNAKKANLGKQFAREVKDGNIRNVDFARNNDGSIKKDRIGATIYIKI